MKEKKDISLENLKILFQNFFEKYNRYPTTSEISMCFGVSAKTIQRKYGSVKSVRKLLNLEVIDFTTGKERVEKVLKSLDISFKEQNKMYKKLVPIFGKHYVHRETPFGDSSRQRSDFFIYHKEGEFYVDIFYATTYENMTGCINSKLKKYDPKIVWGNIIFINTNKEMDKIKDDLIKNKKTKLPDNIKVMTQSEFFGFCNALNPVV